MPESETNPEIFRCIIRDAMLIAIDRKGKIEKEWGYLNDSATLQTWKMLESGIKSGKIRSIRIRR